MPLCLTPHTLVEGNTNRLSITVATKAHTWSGTHKHTSFRHRHIADRGWGTGWPGSLDILSPGDLASWPEARWPFPPNLKRHRDLSASSCKFDCFTLQRDSTQVRKPPQCRVQSKLIGSNKAFVVLDLLIINQRYATSSFSLRDIKDDGMLIIRVPRSFNLIAGLTLCLNFILTPQLASTESKQHCKVAYSFYNVSKPFRCA